MCVFLKKNRRRPHPAEHTCFYVFSAGAQNVLKNIVNQKNRYKCDDLPSKVTIAGDTPFFVPSKLRYLSEKCEVLLGKVRCSKPTDQFLLGKIVYFDGKCGVFGPAHVTLRCSSS